ELSKYAFLLPIVIFSAGAFTVSRADGKITEGAEMVRDIRLDPVKAQDASKNETKVIDTAKSKQDSVRKRELSQESVTDTLNVTIRYDNEMTTEKGGGKEHPFGRGAGSRNEPS